MQSFFLLISIFSKKTHHLQLSKQEYGQYMKNELSRQLYVLNF